MLDFFSIFSKGGLVLWCFQGAGVSGSFAGPVNALIRSVILQERTGNSSFAHNALSLKYKLDNEFELVFVVGFQKFLTLTYVDKFIDDVQLHFRDRYKNELEQKGELKFLINRFEFEDDFHRLLSKAEKESIARLPMKTYSESKKSQKTVKSMIETKGGEKVKEQTGKKNKHAKKAETGGEEQTKSQSVSTKAVENGNQGMTQEEIIQRNRAEFIRKQTGGRGEKINKSPRPQNPKGKVNRVWDMGGTNCKDLDYSKTNSNTSHNNQSQDNDAPAEQQIQVHSMKGELRDVDYESSEDEEEEEEVEEEEEDRGMTADSSRKGGRKGFGGMFGMLKGLVGSKTLTQLDMEPVLEKMKDHLIAKNVAADIASQLCDSVAKKLEGKVMGTFTTVASTVKQALQDSLVQILQPKRRVDILRDVLEARAQRKPFVITFCGVNGVGKSTNLAKVSPSLSEFHQRCFSHFHPSLCRNCILRLHRPFCRLIYKINIWWNNVGAAISMTYITGQPIVFVGTGQTYSDLRSLNARAVVNALMKA
uniref:SRP receptor subunit alpha n=1 Tax=Astyanax mexicanus TaxID=7994 RepID=A0A8B9HVZ1_ASTMX